jgi:predicted dehydrogenase
MLEHFLDCVEKDREPSLTPEVSAIVTDVLVGAYKSMETGSWVDIPLDDNYIVPLYKAPDLK